jgi:hypothetical protein
MKPPIPAVGTQQSLSYSTLREESIQANFADDEKQKLPLSPQLEGTPRAHPLKLLTKMIALPKRHNQILAKDCAGRARKHGGYLPPESLHSL